MNDIRFVFPTAELEQKALDFKQQFYSNGEKTIYGSYKLDQDRYSYAEWLEIINSNSRPETANPKFGTSDTFFAVNADDELVGIINIRYELTAFYENSGHIGCSIAPRHRKKGYSKKMLQLAFERAREHGLNQIKLVCDERNLASKSLILSCGGQLNRVIASDDSTKEEYTIQL